MTEARPSINLKSPMKNQFAAAFQISLVKEVRVPQVGPRPGSTAKGLLESLLNVKTPEKTHRNKSRKIRTRN